jgi:hypothetical protein
VILDRLGAQEQGGGEGSASARTTCSAGAGLKFLVVTGPRIDPASLPRHRGVSIRGYLPDLHRHLAACDLAVVQGGLTT